MIRSGEQVVRIGKWLDDYKVKKTTTKQKVIQDLQKEFPFVLKREAEIILQDWFRDFPKGSR